MGHLAVMQDGPLLLSLTPLTSLTSLTSPILVSKNLFRCQATDRTNLLQCRNVEFFLIA